MIFVFYFFAALLIFLGYKSLMNGVEYLKYFQSRLSESKSDFAPFASIIIPCRGIDQNLRINLTALFLQNYPKYEIIFVVDAETDESVKVIEEVTRQNTERADSKTVTAGRAVDSSQKVHNLREAVLHVSGKSEIFVFVDSDARPNQHWLKNLVAPLQDEKLGCTTGYRWFISKRGGFASQFRAVWNASIASALSSNQRRNFCWGGATAIRRETFEKLAIREKWSGTLSDDFVVMRSLQNAGLPIYFVPQCLTATVEDCTFGELLEFSTRQMKITRVYAANMWKASFVGSFFFTTVFWSGILLLFFLPPPHFWSAFLLLLMIFALGAGKAWLRLTAVKLVLKDYKKELNRQWLWQTTLWTISPALYVYNCLRALFSRKILWRGIEYKMLSPTSTEVISGK